MPVPVPLPEGTRWEGFFGPGGAEMADFAPFPASMLPSDDQMARSPPPIRGSSGGCTPRPRQSPPMRRPHLPIRLPQPLRRIQTADMPDPLNYYRPPLPSAPTVNAGSARAARVLSILSLVCFVIPFALMYASRFMPKDQAGWIAYAVLMPSLFLWLAAGLLAGCLINLSARTRGVARAKVGRATPLILALDWL